MVMISSNILVLYGVFHYSWPMFKVSMPIKWQTEWCGIRIQIIRADVVGIVLFQIFNILCNTGLLDFEVYELVYCVARCDLCKWMCQNVTPTLLDKLEACGRLSFLYPYSDKLRLCSIFHISILWQAECCDVKCQIIRACVVGIAPYRMLSFCSMWNL